MRPLNPSAITIRPAYADDHQGVIRLAALDSAAEPEGPLLLGEVDGELRAAVALRDGTVIADPFFLTLDLVALLRARARALDAAQPRRRRVLGVRRRPRVGAITAA